eukprot:475449_1
MSTAGWLHKQSKYLKVWRKRWAVMDNESFICYKKHDKATSTLTVNVKNIIFIDSIDVGKKYLFNIYVEENKTKKASCYCFECESRSTMKKWISFIWLVIRTNLNHSLNNATPIKSRIVACSEILLNEDLWISDMVSLIEEPHKISLLCWQNHHHRESNSVFLLHIENEKLTQNIFLFDLSWAQYGVHLHLKIDPTCTYMAAYKHCNDLIQIEPTWQRYGGTYIVTVFNINDDFLGNNVLVIEHGTKMYKAPYWEDIHMHRGSLDEYAHSTECELFSLSDNTNLNRIMTQTINHYDQIRTSEHATKQIYARKFKSFQSNANYLVIHKSLYSFVTHYDYPLETLEGAIGVSEYNEVYLNSFIISPSGRYAVTVYQPHGRTSAKKSYFQIHDFIRLLQEDDERYCKSIYVGAYDVDIRDFTVRWINDTTLIFTPKTDMFVQGLEVELLYRTKKLEKVCRGIQIQYDWMIAPLVDDIARYYDVAEFF